MLKFFVVFLNFLLFFHYFIIYYIYTFYYEDFQIQYTENSIMKSPLQSLSFNNYQHSAALISFLLPYCFF